MPRITNRIPKHFESALALALALALKCALRCCDVLWCDFGITLAYESDAKATQRQYG